MSNTSRLWVRSAGVFSVVFAAILLVLQHNPMHLPEADQTTVPVLQLSHDLLELGEVAIGESNAALFTLENASSERALTVNNLFLDEIDSKYFSLSHQAPIILAPNESLSITVSFEPLAEGTVTGSLFINHNGVGEIAVIDVRGGGRTQLEPPIAAANPALFTFGKSNLSGLNVSKPTSLQFGPDGRLYVASMLGEIHVLSIDRDGANNYIVTDQETISAVKNIQNHNDDGNINHNVNNRLVTGLAVTGTPETPVIYVQSSDPRIGGGNSGTVTGLDTNSGVLSRLTKTTAGWNKLDLVRGLPRSDENHHGNGIALAGDKLYLAAGGNTNMGARSHNFGELPEFALSAAILEIDLAAIGDSTYDLPTLDDEDRPGTNDKNDPFGGNRGKNQAKLIPNGPVQVYSPGWRNAYDVVIMQNGRMYSWDNGPNSGWGAAPGNCSNDISEPGVTQHDALHLIEGRGYYAGHPNPTRGNTNNKFNESNPQSPVTAGNPIECNYYGPGTNGNGRHQQNKMLVSLARSTNGLTEYTASNFNGEMKGNLLATSWDNKVYRVAFDAAGDADEIDAIFSNVGSSPLDVTALSDADPFPGTIWVVDFQGNDVVVYEPDDYQGSSPHVCIAGNGSGDADDDGFTDADELVNGSNPCSSADHPADADGDFISDATDPDDDNDGISDVFDPFALDSSNGKNTELGVNYQWENDSVGGGFIANLGFSGLMTNGIDNYQSLYDLNGMTIIGAAGVVTIDEVSGGDPIKSLNSQENGFQFGVNVSPNSNLFRAHTRVLNPFGGVTPEKYQSMGLYIGTGDQDNYTKLVVNSQGFQMLSEVSGKVQDEISFAAPIEGVDYIDLIIEVDPASAVANGIYSITSDGSAGAEQEAGSFSFPATWLTSNTSLAVGIISTSYGTQPFPATWDFITVMEVGDGSNVAPTINLSAPSSVNSHSPVLLSASVTDDGLPDNSLMSQWSVVSGPGSVVFDDLNAENTAASFSDAGIYTLELSATDGELTSSEQIIINVSSDKFGFSEVLYRLNVGGPTLADSNGDWESDVSYVNSGKTWFSSAAINSSGVSDVPSALFTTERYEPLGGEAIEWQLPVTPGSYEVRLYFAEIWFGAMMSGGRIFDAEVEGQIIPDIDVFDIAGGNTAVTQSIIVDSDDILNVKLLRQTQNPALKGIQVIQLSDDGPPNINTAPSVVLEHELSAITEQYVQLEAVVSDDQYSNDELHYQWQILNGPVNAQINNSNSLIANVVFSEVGTYRIGLTVSDGELSTSDEVLITVAAPVSNIGPSVFAGIDQQTDLQSSFSLSGSVSDDGLPDGTVSVEWELISGPAPVVLDTANSVQSHVLFSTVGQYLFRLTATDTQKSSYDEVLVSVTEELLPYGTILYRLNAGGGEVLDATGVWMADDGSFVSGGNMFKTGAYIDTSETPMVPQNIFQTERWGSGTMDWKFPVVPGKYQVNLYFAEIYTGAMSSGARVFNVVVEGDLKTGLDVYNESGGLTGMVTSYVVDSDASLDIALLPVMENPSIKGIEIISVDGPSVPDNGKPDVNAGPDQIVESGQKVALSGVASDDGYPNSHLSYNWSVVSGPGDVDLQVSEEVGSGVVEAVFQSSGQYILQLSVTDGEFTVSDTMTVIVNPPDHEQSAMPVVVYRVNAGGDEVQDASGGWAADDGQFVSGGKTYYTPSGIDTSDTPLIPEAVYQSERWTDEPMSWSFPVVDGQYQVNLYFAEIYQGTMADGARVFDIIIENYKESVVDVYSTSGGYKGNVQTFIVNSDDVLDLTLVPVIENPSIKGLEIIALDAQSSSVDIAPIVDAGPD